MIPSHLSHEFHVADGIFGAGKDEQVRMARLYRTANIAQRHAGVGDQRRKVCEVGDMRQLNDGNVHHARSTAYMRRTVMGNSVFFIHEQLGIEGNDAQDRFAGHFFKLGETGFQ